MARKKPTEQLTETDVLQINQGRVACYILGSTPLIYAAMSFKTMCGLIQPEKRSAATKKSTAKHDPIQEFRDSLYTARTGPTVLSFPAVAFKRALASAAIDTGIGNRTQIDRLVWAIGERVAIYGVPHLRMDVVRSADANRTPDVRTRGIVPEWCCRLELAFMQPAVNETVVVQLLAAAGLIRGIGDFRQGKGAGNYGQFTLVTADDPDWQRIATTAGRDVQQAAIADPTCYDDESEKLLRWWQEKVTKLGFRTNGAAVASGVADDVDVAPTVEAE